MRDRQLFRLTAAARAFGFLALMAPVLWVRDAPALLSLLAIGGVWTAAQLALGRRWAPTMATGILEAALVGAVCGLALHTTLAVLAALVLPPFVAGLHGGVRGLALAVSAELTALVGVALVVFQGLTTTESLGVFTWIVTALGLGLIASFVRATSFAVPDPLAPYLDAQSLIRQLIDISGGLSSGLDVTALSGSILSSVRDQLPTAAVGLYVPRGETLTPLVSHGANAPGQLEECERLAVETWARNELVTERRAFAFPLGESAIVAGVLSARVDLAELGMEADIEKLTDELAASAVHLDTALLFSAFRDSATAEERRRLAREMHDGVAQDIASLGYLVDALVARPASPEQGARLGVLRERITAIVAEVRQSVLTLRTTVGESESLGAAIGSVARHLSESSGVPIQVTLDEQAARLRPEVEAELFRIAQESINNAVKHAQATSIDVLCQVYAPAATITVSDNGRGMQVARSDSHGMKIMRERAELIHADLTVSPNAAGGLTVAVSVAADGSTSDVETERNGERVTT